jgi:pSer/pThr/pTyr-binding forkhead associated (FHA) protein
MHAELVRRFRGLAIVGSFLTIWNERRAMQVKLRVLKGASKGKEITVQGSKFIIGRADECQLRPHSDAISRRHCVLVVNGEVAGVRDLNSRNGTYLNGDRISSDRRLKNGDQLRVGPLEFEVVIEQPVLQAETARQRASTTEASTRQNVGPEGGTGGMGNMVSQWLEEADEFEREQQRLAAPETREYRFDETSRIALETAAAAESSERTDASPKSKGKDEKGTDKEKDKEKDKDKKKKEFGKLPKSAMQGQSPKDSQEAATQVLRKLFNRS